MVRILVVDDEVNIVELLKFSLEQKGYYVISAYDGKKAKDIIKNEQVDLVILDLMLPEIDGFQLCKYIRETERYKDLPVIMLTARNHEQDKYKGFEYGADDYVTKPFSVKELTQRVKAVLRRSSTEKIDDNKINIHNLEIDMNNYTLLKNSEKVELTLKEFELLKLLIQNRGKVTSREILLDKVWGYDYFGETRTVDVHIRHLRKKLEEDDKNPKIIETIRGVGYKIV
ncbi:MAG: response regulator transcription factor [Filifactoraceae bacterium]